MPSATDVAVMVTSPGMTKRTSPSALTVAIVESELSNSNRLSVASAGATSTFSVSVSPMAASPGLFVICTEETGTALPSTVTVNESGLEGSSSETAVMVTCPSERNVTLPLPSTAATSSSEDT